MSLNRKRLSQNILIMSNGNEKCVSNEIKTGLQPIFHKRILMLFTPLLQNAFMERKGLWGNYLTILNKIPFNFTFMLLFKNSLSRLQIKSKSWLCISFLQRSRTWVNEANTFKTVFQKEKWADDGTARITLQTCFWRGERRIMSSCLLIFIGEIQFIPDIFKIL